MRSRLGFCRILPSQIALLLYFSVSGVSANLPSLSILDNCPYAVGFQTMERYDLSRNFRSPRDYFGNPIPGETARPIQVCMWYPANKESSSPPMVYGEYVFPYPKDTRLFGFLSHIQNREIGRLHRLLNNDGGMVLDLLSMEVAAARDIAPAPGRFPVVVYSCRMGSAMVENVAGVSSVGRSSLVQERTTGGLETAARDAEYALTLVREFPAADTSAVAVMGTGSGGWASLLVALRSEIVNTLVMLDPPNAEEDITTLAGHFDYDPRRLAIPTLIVTTQGRNWPDSFNPRDWRYSARTFASCGDSLFVLTHFRLIAAEDGERERIVSAYEATCSRIGAFLDQYLKGIEDSPGYIQNGKGNDIYTCEFVAAQDRPPTAVQFQQILAERGLDVAGEILTMFKLLYNGLGYQYLQRGDFGAGQDLLRWGTMAYPGSANAWDSYAEACLLAGDSVQAANCWRRSLEVLETDTTTPQATKDWLRENTPPRLRELEENIGDK
jgi:hypothetical protein